MKTNNCKFHDNDYCKLRIENKVLERCEKSNCILYRTKKEAKELKEVDAMTKREIEVKEARRNKKSQGINP